MNPLVMQAILQRFLSNKHTTGAALVYGLNWLFDELGPIWFPEHAAQIHATTEQIRKGCFMYATLFAADSSKKNVLTTAPPESNDPLKTDNAKTS